MGWWLFLLLMVIMIFVSWCLQQYGYINNSLWNQQETYIILFGFFSMGIIGFIDDILNIKNVWKIKGLSMRAKILGMVIFSAFIAYWFYVKLGVDYLNLWPIAWKVHLGIFFPILVFFGTIYVVNAVNITDGLDGLVGGMGSVVIVFLAVITFLNQTYLATTVLWVCVAILLAFLFYNINPAKLFMGDSWAFCLWGLIAATVCLLNMRIWIIIPFFVLFLLFSIELFTSGLQMFWKKVFKKKLFPIAPFHHLLEYKGHHEYEITMKFRLIQGILWLTALILIFWQFLS